MAQKPDVDNTLSKKITNCFNATLVQWHWTKQPAIVSMSYTKNVPEVSENADTVSIFLTHSLTHGMAHLLLRHEVVIVSPADQ